MCSSGPSERYVGPESSWMLPGISTNPSTNQDAAWWWGRVLFELHSLLYEQKHRRSDDDDGQACRSASVRSD